MEIYFKIEFNMDIVIEFCKEVKNSVWFAHRFLCSLMRFHSRVSVCRNITFVSQPAITCSNFNNRNIRTRYEICSKSTIRRSGACKLCTHFTTCSSISIFNFEQVNKGRVDLVWGIECLLITYSCNQKLSNIHII